MVTSFSNPLVKQIKRLRQKKYRQQEGVFFVEGLRGVLAAVESGWPIQSIVYCSELLTSDIAWQMLTKVMETEIRCVELSVDIFRSISERDNPMGLGAVIKSQWLMLEALEVRPDDFFVALIEISEPGNLGTILRTVDATGGNGVILVGSTVDPFHPSAVKASMGALFSVPVCQIVDLDVLMRWSIANKLYTVATSARAQHHYRDARYRFPALIMMGSEGRGLPADILQKANSAVAIPMRGSASSLNLAVAAGLLLYELASIREKMENDIDSM